MIRAMGAYFIRRGSRNALYRKVLARYVQMTAKAGHDAGHLSRGRA
jgi:glycerol-3-phosphate O-acyltransferase